MLTYLVDRTKDPPVYDHFVDIPVVNGTLPPLVRCGDVYYVLRSTSDGYCRVELVDLLPEAGESPA